MLTKESQKNVVHRSWRAEIPTIVRGEGIYLFDDQGKRYIDGASGSSVVANIGHGVQSVVEAMYEQGKQISFAAPHLFTNEPLLKLGRIVSERAPGSMKNNCRTWFGTTGTDAVDSALRLARRYHVSTGNPSKSAVIGRWQGFHGNNISVAGVHGHSYRRKLYYPMYVNMPHIPPTYCYRCPFELKYPDCGIKCARELETMIHQTGEENVSAFIAEPVVGAALGSVPAPKEYFGIIREICTKHNVLMILDEVMTAWGRLGYWFGSEAWGVTPDIVVTAKGMSAGYTPMAATIAKEEIWQAIENSDAPFLAGHTMNQNPVSCAGSIAVLQYVEVHDLLQNSRNVGRYLLERLQELKDFDIVGDARGMGLMCGFEFVKDKKSKQPFDPKLKVSVLFEQECMKRGLCLFSCTGCVEGAAGDMMLVTPPLITTHDQVDDIIGIIKDSLKALQPRIS